MTVQATGSRHKTNTDWIIVAVCLLAAVWFLYDGWMSKSFIEEHSQEDGSPDATLMTNRYYAPIGLAVAAFWFALGAVRTKGRQIVADDTGLETPAGRIPYDAIELIDRRYFEKEGHFTIQFRQDNAAKKIKLRDRDYDSLALLLDEIVKQTGAAPAAETEKQDHNNPENTPE